MLLILHRLVDLELEFVGELGELRVKENQLFRHLTLGFGGKIGAVNQLGPG